MFFCYYLQCYWSRIYWTKLGILPQGWNLGLASRIWTYLEPFQGFGPNWVQVPNLGPHFEHCFHISTKKYIYWVFHRVTPDLLVMSCLFPPLISAHPLILIAHWRLQDEVKTMYWTGWQISCNISGSSSWMRPGRKDRLVPTVALQSILVDTWRRTLLRKAQHLSLIPVAWFRFHP